MLRVGQKGGQQVSHSLAWLGEMDRLLLLKLSLCTHSKVLVFSWLGHKGCTELVVLYGAAQPAGTGRAAG